jgi:hypothetical protein
LRNEVAPPALVGGTSSARNRLAAGGTSTNELSVCQNVSPPPRPPIALPSSMMSETTEISGGISRLRPGGLRLDPVLLGDQRRGNEFELAELTGKGQVLLVGHRLAAEAQYQVGEPGGANSGAVRGAKRFSDIDAGDIGAEPCRERSDGDAHRLYSAASRASIP